MTSQRDRNGIVKTLFVNWDGQPITSNYCTVDRFKAVFPLRFIHTVFVSVLFCDSFWFHYSAERLYLGIYVKTIDVIFYNE